MLDGRATPEGTAQYRAKRTGASPAHFRSALGVTVSSIGIGTYLGRDDAATDAAYASSVRRALQLGINVVDSAINYRNQRSERAVAVALRESGVQRDQIVVCTKGGYIPFDGARPPDVRAYVAQTYGAVLKPEDIVAGCHSLAPRFLADQLERSRRNLGVQTIDLYYLHNPETQLGEVARAEFLRRMRAAFELLETACAERKIAAYGTATWNGYRLAPDDSEHLDLHELVALAREVGGAQHHFRAVQLPFNAEMDEAQLVQNQRGKSLLAAARDEGVAVFASASVLQGQLARTAHAARDALDFVRKTDGITCALVGMKSLAHVEENAELIKC